MKKLPKEMTQNEAINEIQNKAYIGMGFLEEDNWGSVLIGNMHHLRQKIAEVVRDEAVARWRQNEA